MPLLFSLGSMHLWRRCRGGCVRWQTETFCRQAEETDTDTRVWRGSEVSTTEQGIKVLGLQSYGPGRSTDRCPISTVSHGQGTWCPTGGGSMQLQSGSSPVSGPKSACPSSPLTRIDSALVLLQRRLHPLLPLSKRTAGVAGHLILLAITAQWALEGLRSEVRPPESQGRGRVVTNMFVRDMDLGVPVAGDNRRFEVVVDGLPVENQDKEQQ